MWQNYRGTGLRYNRYIYLLVTKPRSWYHKTNARTTNYNRQSVSFLVILALSRKQTFCKCLQAVYQSNHLTLYILQNFEFHKIISIKGRYNASKAHYLPPNDILNSNLCPQAENPYHYAPHLGPTVMATMTQQNSQQRPWSSIETALFRYLLNDLYCSRKLF